MGVLFSDLDANQQRITNLPMPVDLAEPATRAWVEQLFNGRAFKPAVRVMVDTNVNIASPGATLSTITMSAGDSVGLMGQTTNTQNGVYIWNSATTAMTRRTDFDTGAEFASGTTFPVAEGTYADKLAIMTTDGTITVGTSPIGFIVMSTTGMTYTASNGIIIVGNDFRLDLSTNSGLLITAGKVGVDYSVLARKFAFDLGNGSATTFLVNHNFGNLDTVPALYNKATKRYGVGDMFAEDVNNVRFTFNAPPTAAQYRAVVFG